MGMCVTTLRRYPVKSMGGEQLAEATLDARGIAGDRWYAVADSDGHFASGKSTRRFRRRDSIFGYAAVTRPDGSVLVSGRSGSWRVGDPALDEDLSRAMGVDVRVAAERTTPHQDMGAVSLIGSATLDWCASRWGSRVDPRRLRVNIVFASTKPFLEEEWAGCVLACGSARLRVVQQVPRCRMIDIDQDGARAEGGLLKHLADERGMVLAMYADVEDSGTVRVGDNLVIL